VKRLRQAIARGLARLSHAAAAQPAPIDWIDYYTGAPAGWWIAEIQATIQQTWKPNPDDPDHPIQESPARDWIGPLAELVEQAIRDHGRLQGDENIAGAFVTALILTTWATRIARAKAFDPHRPIELRQLGYRHWMRMLAALQEATVDESRDQDFFDQPWESPFLADATDGGFV
jgi:hypothetical protein